MHQVVVALIALSMSSNKRLFHSFTVSLPDAQCVHTAQHSATLWNTKNCDFWGGNSQKVWQKKWTKISAAKREQSESGVRDSTDKRTQGEQCVSFCSFPSPPIGLSGKLRWNEQQLSWVELSIADRHTDIRQIRNWSIEEFADNRACWLWYVLQLRDISTENWNYWGWPSKHAYFTNLWKEEIVVNQHVQCMTLSSRSV